MMKVSDWGVRVSRSKVYLANGCRPPVLLFVMFVKPFVRQVGPVGPGDGVRDGVNEDPGKELRVLEGPAHFSFELFGPLNPPALPITETHFESVWRYNLDTRYDRG